MKKIAVLLLSVSPFLVAAQNIKVEAGKKITGVTTLSMDMDMGMGGQMRIESTGTNVITIKSIDGSSYKADNTLTKMKMSQEGAGQNVSFDSEKKEDLDSEMGQEISKELNKPNGIIIDKQSGTVKSANPEKPAEEESGNPFGDLMGGGPSATSAATAAFYVIPQGKKVGDKWTDSTSENGMKVVKNYELVSLKDGIATLSMKASTKGTVKKEMQGSEMEIVINGNTVSTMITDSASGLVKQNNSTANMEGSLEVMGQSLPITMTMSSSSVFE